MKKYKLHPKQKEFLEKYLDYYKSSSVVPVLRYYDMERIVTENSYTESDRKFLNRLRNDYPELKPKKQDEVDFWKPIPLKGKQHISSGYVYAPYIPLNVTPASGIMKRYAKKKINPQYYGSIKVGSPSKYMVTSSQVADVVHHILKKDDEKKKTKTKS